MVKINTKIVIGTANFGQKYGLKNGNHKLNDYHIQKINAVAKTFGINTFDTAAAYGNAESRLSLIANRDTQIITKIGVDYETSFYEGRVSTDVARSLDIIKTTQLYAVLLHRPEVLLNEYGSKIWSELVKQKQIGRIEKIGISIYSPCILSVILDRFDIDIIQVPFSVFDQRILETDWVCRLKSKGVEIHVRSIFLQGLLTMESSELPDYFNKKWSMLFKNWFAFISENNSTADEIALSHCLNQEWIDRIVIGVDSASQLLKLLEIERNNLVIKGTDQFASDDLNLIDPSQWKLIGK